MPTVCSLCFISLLLWCNFVSVKFWFTLLKCIRPCAVRLEVYSQVKALWPPYMQLWCSEVCSGLNRRVQRCFILDVRTFLHSAAKELKLFWEKNNKSGFKKMFVKKYKCWSVEKWKNKFSWPCFSTYRFSLLVCTEVRVSGSMRLRLWTSESCV